nr:unnamed protein product [Digitaria exilis]
MSWLTGSSPLHAVAALTASMNSSSATSLASAPGERHTSSAMPPPRPSYTVTFPSILFPAPLRTATGQPHPKSLPNTSNRGELPVAIVAVAAAVAPSSYKNLGLRSHDAKSSLTLASSNAATARFMSHAAQPSPFPTTSPAVDLATASVTVLPM